MYIAIERIHLTERQFKEPELLARFARGDQRALEELIRDYFPVLCRFAERYLPDSSLAKDVVQETFIKLWKGRGSFESVDALRGYLYVATRNGCLNMNRSRERQESRHLEVASRETGVADPVWTGMERVENIAMV